MWAEQERDGGFGLVEVIVAMFLLSVVSMGMLTFLIQGLKVAVLNSTLETGTQLVSQELELARAQAGSCNGLKLFAATVPAVVTDGRKTNYVTALSPITCPSTYPAVVTFTATVTSNGATIGTATTKILVKAA